MYRPSCCAVAARTAGATIKYPRMPLGVSYCILCVQGSPFDGLIGYAAKSKLWLGGARVLWTISFTASTQSRARSRSSQTLRSCQPRQMALVSTEPFAESHALPAGVAGFMLETAVDSCARNVSGRPRRSAAVQSLELDVFSIFPIIGSWAASVAPLGSCSSIACERPWMRR